jgi:hypothetical protein
MEERKSADVYRLPWFMPLPLPPKTSPKKDAHNKTGRFFEALLIGPKNERPPQCPKALQGFF